MLSPRGWAGWIFLSAAVLVRVVTIVIVKAAPADIILSLNIFGLVLWWIGSAVISFGPGILRSLAFPLCFLFLIIPAPAVVVNWITGTLQHQSAIGATLLFRIAQVPVTREGLIISIPGLDLEVARECSSIRSSTMLIVITLVLAHLFLNQDGERFCCWRYRCLWRLQRTQYGSLPRPIGRSRRSSLPGRQVTPQWRNSLPRPRSDSDCSLIVVIEAERFANFSSGRCGNLIF